MKSILNYFSIILILLSYAHVFAQNTCLEYDGVNDHLSAAIQLANSDFTAELWFRSQDLSSNASNCRPLIHLGSTYNYSLGLCGGILIFYDGGPIFQQVNSLTGSSFNDNQWHFLEFVINGNNLLVYVDCILQEPSITLLPSGTPNIQDLWLGTYAGTGAWDGAIDELKIFNYPKTPADICSNQYCPTSSEEPGLLLYWNFDEGTPNANNTALPFVNDISIPAYNGNFNGFALIGSSSNYINSSTPIVYPQAFNYEVFLKDYPTQTTLIHSICEGDPLHFGLYDNGALISNTTQGHDVIWSYKDQGGSWTPLPVIPYSKFSFGVPRGFITADCSSNSNGFVDREYRAEVDITNSSQQTCTQYSKIAPIRIFCPINPFTVSINPNNDVCEGDPLNLTVCLNSPDPYVMNQWSLVDIKWYVNGVYKPILDDLRCINYNLAAAVPNGLCFKAVVSNGECSSDSSQDCIKIDPKPACGLIDIWPIGSTYPVLESPGVYVICAGDDTQLGIVPPSGFQNCIPTWQYAFSNSGPWNNLGKSNAVQNTNIVPTSSWPAQEIYYRILCNPISGVCPPCTSNVIKLKLRQDPFLSTIVGQQKICKGSPQTLNVNAPQAGHSYTWLCNGAVVGTGISINYTATNSACYQLLISNGCISVHSALFCVEVCEINATLSCPEIPNDCACLGLAITLNACSSSSSCTSSNAQYAWYVDGVLQSFTGCTFTHTPIAAGNTYRVEITDLITGCVGSAERIIVPCNKNN